MCVCTYPCDFFLPAVVGDVWSPLAMREMFCLQALIIQPSVWNSLHFVAALSDDICHTLPLALVLFVAACYSSRAQVCSRRHGAVQGFHIDFYCM